MLVEDVGEVVAVVASAGLGEGAEGGVEAGGGDMTAATASAMASAPQIDTSGLVMPKACSILDPTCEACQ